MVTIFKNKLKLFNLLATATININNGWLKLMSIVGHLITYVA